MYRRVGIALIVSVLVAAIGAPSFAADPPAPSVSPHEHERLLGQLLSDLGPFHAPSAAGEGLMLANALAARAEDGEDDAGAPGGSAGDEIPGSGAADVIANDPTTDSGDNTTQSETTLAVRGNTLCGGYNDSGPGGLSGLSRSTDAGDTWNNLAGLGNNGDPVIAVDQGTGTFYYAMLAPLGAANTGIGVASSTDDCQTFGAVVDAGPNASSLTGTNLNDTTLNDKPWIAVDNTGGANDGNVYVCWTRFIDGPDVNTTADQSELRFSRSTDGGATFVNEQVIEPAVNGSFPFGCVVQVGPAGQVYVTFADRGGATTTGDMRFLSSIDGGQTFGLTTSASTGNRAPGTDNVVACGAQNRTTLNGNIRMLHQSWMAVDTTGGPNNGNIYLVWASDPAGAGDESDAFFSFSSNQGGSWSAPVQLGAGGGATDQFEPFVAVGGTGQVVTAWYDRRNDATNNLNIDLYTTFSQDGGATLDPITRVTDQSFGVPQLNPNFDAGIAPCYMGEYIAVAADNNTAYYLWGDNRNTVTNTAWPSGRPDPDVWFDKFPIPGANQPPTADADGPYTTAEGQDATLDGSGSSDPDGDPLTYEWDYGDDGSIDATGPNPTFDRVGQDTNGGTIPVRLTVTDDAGASDDATTTVEVTNVAPTVDNLATDAPVDENALVTVTGEVNDAGWLEDPLTATIDWGDGSSEAVTGTVDNTRPLATISFSMTHVYGDDGVFPVTICALDDDTPVVSPICSPIDATVDNVDPTTAIDKAAAISINGVPTLIADAGDPVPYSAEADDPGSDDLTFIWDWDDETADDLFTSFANGISTDPDPSPDINPRVDVVDSRSHAFAKACLYNVTLTVLDDDFGTAGDSLATLIQAPPGERKRPHLYWQHEMSRKGRVDHDEATLLCYLKIAGFLSDVFNEETDASTITAAYDVLFKGGNAGSAVQKLERELLTAWLNFANGSIQYGELFDTNGDGTPDQAFSDVMETAEQTRLDPAATNAQLDQQRVIVHSMNNG